HPSWRSRCRCRARRAVRRALQDRTSGRSRSDRRAAGWPTLRLLALGGLLTDATLVGPIVRSIPRRPGPARDATVPTVFLVVYGPFCPFRPGTCCRTLTVVAVSRVAVVRFLFTRSSV